MALPPNYAGYYHVRLLGEEEDYPNLTDISSFLYDFNLLYEFTRVIVDPEYFNYPFSRYSTYRNQKRLSDQDKLKVDSLVQGSPFEALLIVGALPSAAATLWVLVQTAQTISNWRLNRKILQLTRQKLELDVEAAKNQSRMQRFVDDPETFDASIKLRNAEQNFRLVQNRLRENPLRIEEFDISRLDDLPPEQE